MIFCPVLLQSLYFNSPQYQSRNCPTFEIPFHRTSYGFNHSLERSLQRMYNKLTNFDLFNTRNLYPSNPCFSAISCKIKMYIYSHLSLFYTKYFVYSTSV